MIVPLGTLSLGAALPAVAVQIAAGSAGIGATLPDIQARLTQLLALPAIPDLTFAAQLAAAQEIVAALQAAIASLSAIPPLPAAPSIAAALSTQIGSLQALLASLVPALDGLVAFQSLLGQGSIEAYAFDGTANALGSELGAAVGGSGHANALALVARDASTWSAMSQVFKVST